MRLHSSSAAGEKQVLLINAVEWHPCYPAGDARLSVADWFQRWTPAATTSPLSSARPVSWTVKRPLEVEIGALHDFDGVILSGAPRSANDRDQVHSHLVRCIHECDRSAVPFLGVCYGHQLLAVAAGGTVGPNPNGLELATIRVHPTEIGAACPLFRGLADGFDVYSSHQETVLSLGPETLLLGTAAESAVQAIQWRRTSYGVQFHPEADPDTLRFIWQQGPSPGDGEEAPTVAALLDRLTPAPLACHVITNFLEHIIP